MDKKIIISEIIKIIRRYLPSGDFKVLLFGSQARGDSYPTSDIDVGILGKNNIPSESMAKILDDIEEIPTLRKIDIVDLKKADSSFRKEVLNYAKSI